MGNWVFVCMSKCSSLEVKTDTTFSCSLSSGVMPSWIWHYDPRCFSLELQGIQLSYLVLFFFLQTLSFTTTNVYLVTLIFNTDRRWPTTPRQLVLKLKFGIYVSSTVCRCMYHNLYSYMPVDGCVCVLKVFNHLQFHHLLQSFLFIFDFRQQQMILMTGREITGSCSKKLHC